MRNRLHNSVSIFSPSPCHAPHLGRQDSNLQRPDSKSDVLPIAPRPIFTTETQSTQRRRRVPLVISLSTIPMDSIIHHLPSALCVLCVSVVTSDHGRARTFNLLLRRQALFQLSYAVWRSTPAL